jgi:hypothetical protein
VDLFTAAEFSFIVVIFALFWGYLHRRSLLPKCKKLTTYARVLLTAPRPYMPISARYNWCKKPLEYTDEPMPSPLKWVKDENGVWRLSNAVLPTAKRYTSKDRDNGILISVLPIPDKNAEEVETKFPKHEQEKTEIGIVCIE